MSGTRRPSVDAGGEWCSGAAVGIQEQGWLGECLELGATLLLQVSRLEVKELEPVDTQPISTSSVRSSSALDSQDPSTAHLAIVHETSWELLHATSCALTAADHHL